MDFFVYLLLIYSLCSLSCTCFPSSSLLFSFIHLYLLTYLRSIYPCYYLLLLSIRLLNIPSSYIFLLISALVLVPFSTPKQPPDGEGCHPQVVPFPILFVLIAGIALP